MRERTLKSLFDKIMWTSIYLFPLLIYAILCFSFQPIGSSFELYTFGSFMEQTFGFSAMGGPIYHSVYALLFEILEFTDVNGFDYYITYLVMVTIFHVLFDIIVFVPRLFHDFLEKFNGGSLCKK